MTEPIPPTIRWADGSVVLIDQRRLPDELVEVAAADVTELCELIASMAIRGAPALGAAGAMGVALAATRGEDRRAAADALISTRPTAVNLAWGVERALASDDPVAEAQAIAAEDIETNMAIGANGVELVAQRSRILTHCNAGALACVGWGTAVGVIRSAHDSGRAPTVWVDETRPLLQGARLTAWELQRLGIPCTLIADALAASLLAQGEVDLVIVGADRIVANGDVANKVGTYGLALAAARHDVPFYVAAPMSTVDVATASGADIVIEARDPAEVSTVAGRTITPAGVAVLNYAFDVTPADLITAYVTETGVHQGGSAPS